MGLSTVSPLLRDSGEVLPSCRGDGTCRYGGSASSVHQLARQTLSQEELLEQLHGEAKFLGSEVASLRASNQSMQDRVLGEGANTRFAATPANAGNSTSEIPRVGGAPCVAPAHGYGDLTELRKHVLELEERRRNLRQKVASRRGTLTGASQLRSTATTASTEENAALTPVLTSRQRMLDDLRVQLWSSEASCLEAESLGRTIDGQLASARRELEQTESAASSAPSAEAEQRRLSGEVAELRVEVDSVREELSARCQRLSEDGEDFRLQRATSFVLSGRGVLARAHDSLTAELAALRTAAEVEDHRCASANSALEHVRAREGSSSSHRDIQELRAQLRRSEALVAESRAALSASAREDLASERRLVELREERKSLETVERMAQVDTWRQLRENNARCNAELRAELDEVLASRHASECAVALQTERLALEAAEEVKERNRYVVAREEFAALVSDTRDREEFLTRSLQHERTRGDSLRQHLALARESQQLPRRRSNASRSRAASAGPLGWAPFRTRPRSTGRKGRENGDPEPNVAGTISRRGRCSGRR